MSKLRRQKHPNAVRALQAKRAELLSGFKGKLDPLRRMEIPTLDDLAPVLHDQFIALQLSQLDFQHLKLIDEAMTRVTQGNYGVCMDCDSAIAPKRLQAIAWAARCVTCEDSHVMDGQLVREPVDVSAD